MLCREKKSTARGGRHNQEWSATRIPSRTTLTPTAHTLPRAEFAVSTSIAANDSPAILTAPQAATAARPNHPAHEETVAPLARTRTPSKHQRGQRSPAPKSVPDGRFHQPRTPASAPLSDAQPPATSAEQASHLLALDVWKTPHQPERSPPEPHRKSHRHQPHPKPESPPAQPHRHQNRQPHTPRSTSRSPHPSPAPTPKPPTAAKAQWPDQHSHATQLAAPPPREAQPRGTTQPELGCS